MQSHFKDDRAKFALAMQLWQGKPIEDKMIRNFMMRYDQGIKGQFSQGDDND